MRTSNKLKKSNFGKDLLKKIFKSDNSEKAINLLKPTYLGPNARCNLMASIHQRNSF